MMIDDIIPSEEDLQNRIQVNIDKGMTLKEIETDTINLIRNCEITILRCQVQVHIYNLLLDRIKQRGV